MPDNLFPEDDEYEEEEYYDPDDEDEGSEEENEDEDEEGAGYKPSIFFDFETGDFVRTHDGKLKEASGYEAWKQWCIKTCMTQRYACEAYSDDIAIDFEEALKAETRAETESILRREIEEALMADPSERTLYVGTIDFNWQADSCLVDVKIQGIDGDADITFRLLGNTGEEREVS